MTDSQIRAVVFQALDNAVANGYDMFNEPVDQVAMDLIGCCRDFEEIGDYNVLVPHIEAWKQSRKDR